MALEIRSFFIGIATVLGLLVVGFGGGIMMGGVISGDQKTPSKVERQAAKETTGPIVRDVQPARDAPAQPKDPGALARDLDAIKPTQPMVVMPVAKPEPAPQQAQPASQNPPTQAQAAPAPAPEPVATQPAPPAPPQPQPAPQPAPAPTMTVQTPPQPALGAERQVSLPQPTAEPQFLSRREQARLRVQQRREERTLRREERRKLVAARRQQELLRREEMKASERSKPEAADDDDDDNDDAPPRFIQRRGLFDMPPFRLFGH